MKIKLSSISVILIFTMIFGSLVSCGEPSDPVNEVPSDTNVTESKKDEPDDVIESTEPLETFEKVYSTATIDEDFKIDRVYVEVQPYMYDHEYTADDFAEVGCIKVHISAATLKRIITVFLEVKSKQNVIDAIKKLEKRPDIVIAKPFYNNTGKYLAIPNEP